MATIAEMMVKIGLDGGDFDKGITGLQDKTQKLGDGMTSAGKTMSAFFTGPIVALGAGMLALGVKTGDYADRILDLADITGMSTDAIQGWQRVAGHAGVETEAVTKASEKLTKTMYNLEQGSEKQTQAIGKLGLSYEDLAALSPDEQMDMLMTSLSAVEDPAERARIGTDLLGGAFKDIAPIVSMTADEMMAMKEQGTELGMTLEELQEANAFRQEMESLKAEFGSVTRSLASDLMPILQGVLLPFLRDTIVPAVTGFIEKLAELASWFANLSGPMQLLIVGFTGLLAAIGPVLVVAGTLISSFTKVMGVAKLLAPIIGGISLPVLGVIAAFAALIAIGVLVYKNWDTIKTKAIEIWGSVKEFLSNTWESIKKTATKVWNSIKDFFAKWGTTILAVLTGPIGMLVLLVSRNWDTIKNTTTQVFNAIKGFISSIWNGIKSIFSSVISGIVSFVTGRFNAMRSTITSIINGVRSTISSVLSAISSTFSSILSSIVNVVTSRFNAVKSAVRNGIMGALNIVKGLGSSFLAAGRGLIDQVVKGITGALGKVKAAGEKVASTIRNLLPFSPAKEGPLSDLDKLDFAGPIDDSIRKGEKLVQRSMANMLTMPAINGAEMHLPDVNSNESNLEALLERIEQAIINSEGAIYLDTGELVGATYNQYDRVGGDRTSLKERWGR